MWNAPTEKQLAKIPPLYSTEGQPIAEKKVLMHFFLNSCDWYVTEYNPGDRLFFGFAILNGDLMNAEWGCVSLDELLSLKSGMNVNGKIFPDCIEVDRDLHWNVRKASEVEKIVEANGIF